MSNIERIRAIVDKLEQQAHRMGELMEATVSALQATQPTAKSSAPAPVDLERPTKVRIVEQMPADLTEGHSRDGVCWGRGADRAIYIEKPRSDSRRPKPDDRDLLLPAIDHWRMTFPNSQSRDALEAATRCVFHLLDEFAARGLVLTVEQVPLKPLAMGHYRTDVSVRPAREAQS